MNSLHKKRDAFRQAIRSKSIQDIFRKKRQHLFEQLRLNLFKESHAIDIEDHHHHSHIPKHSASFSFGQEANTYQNLKRILTQIEHELKPKDQEHILVTISQSSHFRPPQKIDLLSKLINRKEFALDSEIETNYGWKKLVDDFLTAINQQQEPKRDNFQTIQTTPYFHFFNKFQETQYVAKSQTSGLKSLICFSLIKLWQIKPKPEYFLTLTKTYHLFHQKLSNSLSLTLIAELSYDRVLLPNYQFITKLLQVNIDKLTEVKFFRTLEILKNFIFHFKVENNQVHPRQLIFEYIAWIKVQINFLLCTTVQNEQNHAFSQKNHSGSHESIMSEEMQFETKYCLIYLLFTTLNKLYEINESEKEHMDKKQILILNEEILNHSENHTTMKFMIQEGKAAIQGHHKNNILRTLTFFINFLELSNLGKHKEENNLAAELEEIERTFQGIELNWSESFN